MSDVTTEYLIIEEQLPVPKRRMPFWVVRNKRSGEPLGTIDWYGGWRQYTFRPLSETRHLIFSSECLRDIAGFLEKQTQEGRFALMLQRGPRRP